MHGPAAVAGSCCSNMIRLLQHDPVLVLQLRPCLAMQCPNNALQCCCLALQCCYLGHAMLLPGPATA